MVRHNPQLIENFGKHKIWGRHKIINEIVGFVLQLILAIFSAFLGFTHRISLFIVFAIIMAHFCLVGLTNYRENHPGLILHFNRTFLGVVRVATPIAAISYFITLLLGSFSPQSNELAEFSLLFVYLTIPWTIFAGHSPLGGYFAYSVILVWTPKIFNLNGSIDPPFIVYIAIAIISLMAVGTWISNLFVFWGTITKKEDHGSQTEKYEKYVWVVLIAQFLFGIAIILLEGKIMEFLLLLF